MSEKVIKNNNFFIKRPVFASVISIIIVLIGMVCLYVLPVEQYPRVLPITVTVTAQYPGASPETLATTVAAPLEQQINGVENMLFLESVSSASGTTIITVTFDMNVDPDKAQIDVNNKVQSVLPFLPEEVTRLGVMVDKGSSTILEVITLTSKNPDHDELYLNNFTSLNVIDELNRTEGVENAEFFGAMLYSMRVWLKPDKLAEYNLTVNDIVGAVKEQNSQYVVGQIGAEPISKPIDFTYNINTKGRLSTVDEFENIVVRSSSSDVSAIRLADVARVELGSSYYGFSAKLDSKPAVAVGIFLQSGANALQTAKAIKAKMEELSKTFPDGIYYKIPYDTTKFVKISVQDLVATLFEAVLLVIAIVFLFIQKFRATTIALIAIPISLIGTFIGMYVFGFSINLLTLFGLVLAIGIVVDDAIVVIENVDYRMRDGKLTGKEAAILAMKEVSWPIITISLVLCTVFIPVSFISGLVGVMYRQFAITIAVSVILSAVVSLTLTPVLCAMFLRQSHKREYVFFSRFNDWFEKITDFYIRGVKYLLSHAFIGVVIFIGFVGISFLMFTRLPSALLPNEDQGYLISPPFLAPGASFARSDKAIEDVTEKMLKNENIENIISLTGFDIISNTLKTNSGTMFIILKDWDLRKGKGQDSQSVAGQLMGIASRNQEAIVPVFNPPPIIGLSSTGGFEVYLQYKGSSSDFSLLNQSLVKYVAAANQRPELNGVQTTFSYQYPQFKLEIDRDNVKSLGINLSDLYTALAANLSSLYVNDFTLHGRNYRVNLMAESDYRRQPEDVKNIFVRSNTGALVSLGSLVRISRTLGTDKIERFNLFPAAKILGNPAPGYSMGQALNALDEVLKEKLDSNYAIGLIGEAYQQKTASNTGVYVLIFGIVMVFLILAALYERWTLPLAVILNIPIAIFGSLVFTKFRGLYNDVYFQVGILTLVGLSAKNAILIVEFAVLEFEKGASIIDSILFATKLRFRAIIMTSSAFILGCVPLYLSSGASSASKQAVGTGVIGGMLASTFISTFFVPLFFKIIMELSEGKIITKNKDQEKLS